MDLNRTWKLYKADDSKIEGYGFQLRQGRSTLF